MENNEEILLEQYFRRRNLNTNDRDICIYLLRNIKEVSDSEVLANSNSVSAFDLITVDLEKKDGAVYFNGAIANSEENKWIDGIISKRNNKYIVASRIYRLYEYLEDDDRDYASLDVFTMKNDSVERKTNYIPVKSYFEAEIAPLNEMELYEYYSNKIHGDEIKKGLN